MALVVVGMFGLFFLGALYLQRILGYSPLEVGLAFLPSTVVMGVVSLRFAEPLSTRFGPRTTLIPALALTVVGLLLFSRSPVHGTYVVDVMPATIILGLGMGLSMPALMTLAMSVNSPMDAGLASGLVNTTVQVGGAIGLAVLATLASERTGASQTAQALNSGYHLAFVIGAILMAASVLVAVVVLRQPRPRRDAGHAPLEYSASVT
jgi:MFS family permease